jgi:hypothetical protein
MNSEPVELAEPIRPREPLRVVAQSVCGCGHKGGQHAREETDNQGVKGRRCLVPDCWCRMYHGRRIVI